MDINEKDLKKIIVILLILALTILAFFIVRPVLLSVIAGLILAYIFNPVYSFVISKVKSRNISASICLLIAIIIIVIPAWFVIPLAVDNVFGLFRSSTQFDVRDVLTTIFPSSSEEFITQIALTINSGVSRISSSILNRLLDLLINSATILLHLFIVGFIFFFSLRDRALLKDFMLNISPISKRQEGVLVKQFKDITEAIVYGQVIIGLVQGLVAGLGFILFGIDNAFVLTVLAIVFSVIPIVGPGIVWIPVTIFLFAAGTPLIATGYLLYNLFVTSTIDNFLRIYIVARKSDVSQAVILTGMIGGLLVFGILGLILGPLILAYFITLLRIYKEGAFLSIFKE